jgi:hypothetical protein
VAATSLVLEMVIVVEGDRWEALMRRLAPLLIDLERWVEQWLDEQARALVDEPRLNSFVVLAERFPKLPPKVDCVVRRFEERSGDEVPRCLLEPIIALVGMDVAARRARPSSGSQRAALEQAGRALLELWSHRGGDRNPDLTAPHVAAAYLSGVWAPAGWPRFAGRWEPARLQLGAMTYKMVHHGAHSLANMPLAPWTQLRQDERCRFDSAILAGAQRIVSWLVRGDGPPSCRGASLAAWDWEQRTLWEFLHGVVLGPGRPGGGNGHPLAGAFLSSMFGCWAELAVGTTVGTVEVFVCTGCGRVRDLPGCEQHPGVTVIATGRRHRFVTPRDRLEDVEPDLGHLQVKRRVCKNPTCVKSLSDLDCWADAEPIYPAAFQDCPHCHTNRFTGQRPVTVWTKRP